MNNLAWLLAVREHKGAEALSLLNRALEITGPDANFLDTLGTVELSLGKAQLAATHFEQALAQTPSVTRYFHLAQARMMDGDRKLAEQAWRKSRELSPKGKLFPPSIHPLERPEYARLRDEFDGKPVAEAR
jgi:tetratricopeptide (TPR) repeat protein